MTIRERAEKAVELKLRGGYNCSQAVTAALADQTKFCKGCRSCHNTAKCVMDDDILKIMGAFDDADIIVSVSPSYWADIPWQYKAFIDRCTPWCDTHEPHASIREGKKGYTIALRTGPGMHECDRIIQSIEHFYGHLHIECSGHLGLTSIEYMMGVLKLHFKNSWKVISIGGMLFGVILTVFCDKILLEGGEMADEAFTGYVVGIMLTFFLFIFMIKIREITRQKEKPQK